MTATIPDREPAQLRCGDTWRWTRSLADYPATTWTLKYRYKTASTGFEIVASADGTDHSVTHAASTTGGYTAGSYNWTAWVESGAEKYTIAEGVAQLLPDFRTADAATGVDARSHARKTLDALEAWIEGRSIGVAEYEIAGRRMKTIPIPDLLVLRSKYQSEVRAEQAATQLARGTNVGRRIQFRM